MRNIKVLHIATIDFSIKKLLLDKMLELRKYGYEIEFMSDDTGLVDSIEKAGFTHITLKMSRTIHPLQDIKSIIILYRILKKASYTIVHTHTAKAGMIGRIAARLAGIPIVVHTSHGLPFYEGQSFVKKFIYKKLEQMASLFSDGYFSQNREDLKIIEEMVSKKVLTGYEGNGVNINALDTLARLSDLERRKLRDCIGILEDEFVFLMAARFESVKNHRMLLRSITNVKQNTFPFKVLLAGKGPLFEDVKSMAEELGIDDKVIFLGFCDNILEILQVSDAVILTSEKEGIPRILMEAMSLSKPVLATDVLGTNELVLHKVTGELVELNNVVQLTKTMEKWIDPSYSSILESYGKNGRRRIELEFTEAKVAERIDRYYRELIHRKKGYSFRGKCSKAGEEFETDV